jgi:hypothetical protein
MNDDNLMNFDDLDSLGPDPGIKALVTEGELKYQRMTREEKEQRRKELEKERKDQADKEKARNRMRARLSRRAVYDLPEGMKQEIEKIATDQDTTASQVAGVFLALGLDAYRNGTLDLDDRGRNTESRRYKRLLESGFSALGKRKKRPNRDE